MSSSSDDFLNDRRRALEESFFMERNQQLLEKMRQQLAAQEKKKALAEASGITDETVLDHLLAANISDETIAALGIVPLVAIAWADGELDEREKQAVLAGCESEGISPGSLSYELLQRWLNSPIDNVLIQAWKDFVHAASKQLSPTALEALKSDVVGRARKVAHASGGILGIGSISQVEQNTLRELERAFQV